MADPVEVTTTRTSSVDRGTTSASPEKVSKGLIFVEAGPTASTYQCSGTCDVVKYFVGGVSASILYGQISFKQDKGKKEDPSPVYWAAGVGGAYMFIGSNNKQMYKVGIEFKEFGHFFKNVGTGLTLGLYYIGTQESSSENVTIPGTPAKYSGIDEPTVPATPDTTIQQNRRIETRGFVADVGAIVPIIKPKQGGGFTLDFKVDVFIGAGKAEVKEAGTENTIGEPGLRLLIGMGVGLSGGWYFPL